MSNDNFYRDLDPFHSFVEEAFDLHYYVDVPDDWVLLVADITGSTRAVDAGSYAEVNYLGAACIVAVSNALEELVVPSVFGGDGATFAVPEFAVPRAISALKSTQLWGKASFGLDLRVGAVPMAEILGRGASLQIAKMEFSPGNSMAMFRGDGFDLADSLVKGDPRFLFEPDADDELEPDLESLSCRWSPMPSEHGAMLCLIVGARTECGESADVIYRDVIERINGVVGINQVDASPVKVETLDLRVRMDNIAKEAKTIRGPFWFNIVRVVAFHVFAWFLFKFNRTVGEFDPVRYREEVVINSDFRKVNGMLRLILDCTESQCGAIEAILQGMHVDGRIVFGAHRATQAIMTCVVPDASHNEHVHYVDGSEGGLWSAAKGLKVQIRELEKS